MDRLGLGYDTARKLNAGIVYCSITGFGAKGGHDLPGYDLLVQATSADHVSDRLQRVQARPELPQLLAAGVYVEVWGWSLRDGHWRPKRVQLCPGDLQPLIMEAPPPRRRPRRGERQGELFG